MTHIPSRLRRDKLRGIKLVLLLYFFYDIFEKFRNPNYLLMDMITFLFSPLGVGGKLFHCFYQKIFGFYAYKPIHFFTIFKKYKCRYAAYIELLCHRLIGFNV